MGAIIINTLREAFRHFKTWMVQVYKTFAGLDVELTDDVRQIFDRLVATDEAIARNMEEMGPSPIIAARMPSPYRSMVNVRLQRNDAKLVRLVGACGRGAVRARTAANADDPQSAKAGGRYPMVASAGMSNVTAAGASATRTVRNHRGRLQVLAILRKSESVAV